MQKENQETLVLERTIKQLNEQFNQYIMNNDNQNKNGREQSLQRVIKRLTEENKELKEQIMKYQSFIKSIKQNINNLGK